jgi:hypothetical protein
MTATTPNCRATQGPGDEIVPARSRGPLAYFALILTALFIFAHGCHGDDVDHEPSVAPPVPSHAGDEGH